MKAKIDSLENNSSILSGNGYTFKNLDDLWSSITIDTDHPRRVDVEGVEGEEDVVTSKKKRKKRGRPRKQVKDPLRAILKSMQPNNLTRLVVKNYFENDGRLQGFLNLAYNVPPGKKFKYAGSTLLYYPGDTQPQHYHFDTFEFDTVSIGVPITPCQGPQFCKEVHQLGNVLQQFKLKFNLQEIPNPILDPEQRKWWRENVLSDKDKLGWFTIDESSGNLYLSISLSGMDKPCIEARLILDHTSQR